MDPNTGTVAYRAAKNLVGRLLNRAYDIEIEGAERVPRAGGVILCPNHRSFMDSLFVPGAVDRPVAFLAKSEYFDKRRTAWLFKATGQIPVRRGTLSGAKAAFVAAREVLVAGGIVGIYPEGTRSRDGLLHRGNLGPARLALETGSPLVPIGLIGTDAVQPPDAKLPRTGLHVGVRFGEPLWAEFRPANPRLHVRDLTERLMGDIARLSGQAYERGRRTDEPLVDVTG